LIIDIIKIYYIIIRIVIKMNVEDKRRRLKKRWLDTIENDMRAVGVCVGDLENRDEWRFRATVADSKVGEKAKEA
jgi:hypothetical protein